MPPHPRKTGSRQTDLRVSVRTKQEYCTSRSKARHIRDRGCLLSTNLRHGKDNKRNIPQDETPTPLLEDLMLHTSSTEVSVSRADMLEQCQGRLPQPFCTHVRFRVRAYQDHDMGKYRIDPTPKICQASHDSSGNIEQLCSLSPNLSTTAHVKYATTCAVRCDSSLHRLIDILPGHHDVCCSVLPVSA